MGIILLQFVGSFLASVGFGILMNVPRSELVFCGLSGMCAWVTSFIVRTLGGTDALATFCGSLVVGVVSFYLARYRKMPVTIFNIPGIFPLVPGIMIYRTFMGFIDKDFTLGLIYLSHTFVIAFAIGGAMISVELLHQVLLKISRKKTKQ